MVGSMAVVTVSQTPTMAKLARFIVAIAILVERIIFAIARIVAPSRVVKHGHLR